MPNPRGLDDAEQIKFNIGETPREWMYRHDIAIADRCEGHEAEIDEVPGNGRIILKRRETIECPSTLAVFRLMAKSNFAGCWTGRSAGSGEPPPGRHGGFAFVS